MRMDQSEPQALIERYTRGHQAVLDALAGVSEAQLDYKSDGWRLAIRELIRPHRFARSPKEVSS
jgi:hypothetical protein